MLAAIFGGVLVGTILITIFAKSVLGLYGLESDIISSSIGDYISSLLGAIAGVMLTMMGTLLLEMHKKRSEKEEEKKEKAILLYYDLQVLLRKIICRYCINNIAQNNISVEDPFYNDLDNIFKDINNESFQELLTNTERVKILTSLDIKSREMKIKFINFLSSDKLKFLKDINYDILENYKECKKAYNSSYNYVKKMNDYINLYKYDKEDFDFMNRNPLVNQISICVDLHLKEFFAEESWKQKKNVGNAIPVVNDNGEMCGIFYDTISFDYDQVRKSINYYRDNEKFYENEKNNFINEYREFDKLHSKEIRTKINNYREDLIKSIELDNTFDEVIKMIKKDNHKFWNVINSEENYVEEIILNNQISKIRKLNNISFYLKDSFLYGRDKNTSSILVAIENGVQKYVDVELCNEMINYRKKEYFEKCSEWNKVCEFFDFDLAKIIFWPERYVEYISNEDNIGGVLFPKFRESILPENIEKIQDAIKHVNEKDIFEVIKEIKGIAEINE